MQTMHGIFCCARDVNYPLNEWVITFIAIKLRKYSTRNSFHRKYAHTKMELIIIKMEIDAYASANRLKTEFGGPLLSLPILVHSF